MSFSGIDEVRKAAEQSKVPAQIAADQQAMDTQPQRTPLFDPTTGETPITDLPKPGGAGGSQQAMEYYAGKKFYELFGRNPTSSELAMLSSAFQGDKNIANLAAGNAAVAQYFNTFANSPENIQKNKQTQATAAAPKFYDQVNQMFQTTLGRDATQDEKQHFGMLMSDGHTDAYTIQQFLSALPEAVQKQDAAFRSNLNSTLQSQDAQYYREQILPAIQSNALKSGRSLDASGIQNSLALAAQQQNRGREGFLSNLTASQYGSSQALAQDAYARAYGAQQDLASYSRSRSDSLLDAYSGRINTLNDYNIQKQAYDQYLQRYGKRNGGVGQLAGGLAGAGLGSFAGPQGALAGYQVGSGLGSYFGQ